jgi:drug/metabolite transporter (DMT)-like permease
MTAARTWMILFAGILVLSNGAIFAKLVDAPAVWVACMRCGLATAIFGVWFLVRRGAGEIPLSRRDIYFGMLGGLFLATHLGTWFASMNHTSVATSLLFVSTSPIWALLLGIVLRLEHGSVRKWAACGLAFAGAALLAFDGGWRSGGSLLGIQLATISGAAMGFYMLCARAKSSQAGILRYVLVVYGTAALALGGLALATGQATFAMPIASYGWLLAVAVGPQVIGHTTINWAVPKLGASTVGIALLLEPVLASVSAFFVFAERPTSMIFISGSLIIAGIFILLTQPPTRKL